MPQYPDNANVRLNVAAVLREEKVFRKKQEEEAKILKQYEQDLRDSSEFEDWKQKGREKDEEDLRQKIEKTKEEIAQLSLEAQKAKILNVAKNQLAAAELQGDIASKLHEKREADEEEKERLMRQAEELNIETKNAVDEAKRLLAEKKKENAEQMAAEKAQRAKEVAEQKAIEDAKRREIILQIKALERIPQTEGRYQQFDPTTTPGYGLMDEMSLIELRDRLVMLQERELREREERRKGILAQKAEKDEEMAARVDFIAKLRQKSNIEAKGRRDKEAQLAEERRQRELKKHNDNAEKMHSKLTSKKDDKIKELERLESEARAIRERNKLLADDKSAQEMRQFSQLQKGAERAAKNRIDQKRMQEAKDKEVRSRIDRDRRQENERKEIQLDSDVHTMKSKLASEKARLEALRQQQFNDLHIKAAVDRAMARLSKIEADERNPQVAIEHILQEDSAYMDESEFI
ncbi:MAG: putative myosin heavy [Streblomastix strix]|uniref:Putative myosin heavy n=2 Tax=Streblomastix strix TaxID=222440 RepID=A0A5J4WNV7_9EUKA|nr:MAG: putative myosin heavy [Streblomastix strix]